MNHAKTYHTKQQNAILQFLIASDQKYHTVSQIAEYLKERGESVGLTTIYRQLDKFQKEGIVQKIVLDGNSGACYQYVGTQEEESKFLLKCEDCGDQLRQPHPRVPVAVGRDGVRPRSRH